MYRMSTFKYNNMVTIHILIIIHIYYILLTLHTSILIACRFTLINWFIKIIFIYNILIINIKFTHSYIKYSFNYMLSLITIYFVLLIKIFSQLKFSNNLLNDGLNCGRLNVSGLSSITLFYIFIYLFIYTSIKSLIEFNFDVYINNSLNIRFIYSIRYLIAVRLFLFVYLI